MAKAPAYAIPLNAEGLATLGEIVVILGQIEEEMVLAVSGLLKLDRPTTEKVMGSTKMADKSAIWSALIDFHKPDDHDLLAWVDYANTQMQVSSTSRNDFVHANWWHRIEGRHPDDGSIFEMFLRGGTHLPGQPAAARRISKHVSVRKGEEMESVRDHAAELSCVMAHITHVVSHADEPPLSPWRNRLPERPPGHLAKVKARKATGQTPPPPPSRA